MTRILFCFLFLSVAVVLEAALQSLGLILPLTAFAVLYFSFIYRSVFSFLLAFLAGFCLDSIFGYPEAYSSLFMLAVVPIAYYVYAVSGGKSILAKLLVGALLPLLVSLPPILLRGGWETAWIWAPNLFLSSIFSAIFLPVAIFVLDRCSHFLALPEFSLCDSTRPDEEGER